MNRVITVTVLAGVCVAGCKDSETAKRQFAANGDRFVSEQKFGEAIVEYRNALREDPQFGEARLKLAEAYLANKNPAAAVREYVRAADGLPNDMNVQMMAGRILLLQGRFEDARTRAEKVIARDAKNVDALMLRASAMAGMKDVAGAIAEMEEASRLVPGDGRLLTGLGSLQLLDGSRAEAEAAFRQAMAAAPNDVSPKLALANFFMATGRLPEGEAMLKTVLASAPDHTSANRLLAALYVQSGRLAEAEQPLAAAARNSSEPTMKLALADYYARTNRSEQAVSLLKELATDKASFVPATIRLARAQRASGNRDEGYRAVEEVLKASPAEPEALATRSEWELEDGQTAKALASARAAVESAPESAHAQFALGAAQVASKDNTGAIASFREVLRLNPRVFSAKVLLSRLEAASGDADAAIQVAQEARQANPKSVDARLAVANGYLAKGDLARAAPEVRALVSEYPQVAETQLASGRLLFRQENWAGARAAYSKALEIDPTSAAALNGLLAVDARTANIPAAVARIEAQTAKNPNDPQLQYVAARTYAAAEDLAKSEAALNRVIAADPAHLDAYLMLARIYVSQKRLDSALKQFETAAQQHPAEVGPATMSAMLLQLQGKTAEAQKRYEAILARSQRAPLAANNLAYIYAETGGNLDLALQLAQSAKSQMPDSAPINDTLGWIYYKKELANLAVPPLEISVKNAPDNPTYHYHLGLAYAKVGQRDRARQSFESALKLNPNLNDARTALAAL